MFDSIWSDIKRELQYGNNITRLIIINVIVFVIINILKLVLFYGTGGSSTLYREIIEWLSFSSNAKYVILRFWTSITSMFLHEGFMHLLFNMLFLYWFGRIVGDFIGNNRVVSIYLLGGIAGCLAFFISANLSMFSSIGDYAYGASAATMAFVVAAAKLAPDYKMRLLFLGDVSLKYIAATVVFLDLIGTAGNSNTGGHFGHLGGALMGYAYIAFLQKGTDLAEPFNMAIDYISDFFNNIKHKKRFNKARKSSSKRTKGKAKIRSINETKRPNASFSPNDFQEKLDAILEKIKKEGYDSLSEKEKEFLNHASKK